MACAAKHGFLVGIWQRKGRTSGTGPPWGRAHPPFSSSSSRVTVRRGVWSPNSPQTAARPAGRLRARITLRMLAAPHHSFQRPDVQDWGAFLGAFGFAAFVFGGTEAEPGTLAGGRSAAVALTTGNEPVALPAAALASGEEASASVPRYWSSNPAALCSVFITMFRRRTLPKNSLALILSPRPM